MASLPDKSEGNPASEHRDDRRDQQKDFDSFNA
jgi:hypothetical protein